MMMDQGSALSSGVIRSAVRPLEASKVEIIGVAIGDTASRSELSTSVVTSSTNLINVPGTENAAKLGSEIMTRIYPGVVLMFGFR